MRPGSRDLFANVIKVSTPNNFFACNLAFAAGIGQFHGMRMRDLSGGQFPVVVYKSINRGKSQGKSGVARLGSYLTSDWKTNKLSPKLSTETIKKKCSFTTCPIYFDDVKKDTFIARITEGFDDGDTYETAEGVFPRRAEVFFSANYFSMDEEATSDSERTCDRLTVIPFQEWGFMPAAEFSRRQSLFKSVVDCETKPTELVIGELGDFINSQEFLVKREAFAQWLYDKAEVVKIRTLLVNYGSFIAINWKLHQIFETVWDDMGYTWEGFEEWVEVVLVPFLVSQHMEKDHAVHSLRRYVNGILNFAAGMSETEVQKFMRICTTKKTKDKHVLAIHPDKRYPDMKQLGYVKLTDVKKHLPSVGGLWDDSTYATLVRNEVDDLDTSSDDRSNMVAKRALFIPFTVFTSSQKMKICDITGQKEYYSLADSETPSGVEDVRNSTAATSGLQLRLALSDVSRINVPANETMNEVALTDDIFNSPEEEEDARVPDRPANMSIQRENYIETDVEEDELEDELDETITDNIEYPCSLCNTKMCSLERLIAHMQDHQKQRSSRRNRKMFPCEECSLIFKTTRELEQHNENDHDENLSEESNVEMAKSITEANKSKPSTNPLNEKNVQVSKSAPNNSFKANASQDITIVNDSFVCACGFNATSKSGSTRHKCHKEKLLLKCSYCEKRCGNAGSLKLHMRSKHKEEMKNSAANTQEALETMIALDEEDEEEIVPIDGTIVEQQSNAGMKCAHCEKVCASSGSLKNHMKYKHKDEMEKSAALDKSAALGKSVASSKSTTLEKSAALGKSKTLEKSAALGMSSTLENSTAKSGKECMYCEKTCATVGNLKQHIKYKHKEELENTAAAEVESTFEAEGTDEQATNKGVGKSNVNIRKSVRRRSISNHKNKTSASRKKI